MPLDLVANIRLPTEKAHGLAVMRQAEAFARAGARLRVLVATRAQSAEMRGQRDPFAYYDCPRLFPVVRVPTLDAQIPLEPHVGPRARRALFLLQSGSFAAWAPAHALALGSRRRVYTRDPYHAAGMVLCGAGGRTMFEAHRVPSRGRGLMGAVLRRLAGVVAISGGVAEGLAAAGVPSSRILVAPDGVRLEDFAALPPPARARVELDLPPDTPLVVYTGHLFPWKGVDTLVEAARWLPAEACLLLVGGTVEDRRRLEALRAQLPPGVRDRVRLQGHVPPREVPLYLAAAEVLVLPSSARDPMGERYTSPLKLFEYMAARRAIVASDVPALREVLAQGETAELVPPDQPEALGRGLARLLAAPEARARLAAEARRRVEGYTWQARARRILAFLDQQI